jgi:hypothetical protein
MFPAKRFYPIVPTPVDSGTSNYVITPGMIEDGIVLTVPYSANVTAAGTAVKARSLPVRRVLLKDEQGNTLQMWKAQDLISAAQIFEQAAVGAMLVPPAGFGIANNLNLFAHIPLKFKQYGNVKNADMTSLPTFAYKGAGLTLTVEWGSVFDLLVTGGALAGTVTFGNVGVLQIDQADRVIPNGRALASIMPIAVNRYLETVNPAVASTLPQDIGTIANIRAVMITQELTPAAGNTNGEPTNTIVRSVSFVEDNTLNVFASVPWETIQAENAKHYGVTMPTGVAIIDFAEGGDLADIYKATLKNKVRMDYGVAAVAGTIRTHLLTIAAPRQFAA